MRRIGFISTGILSLTLAIAVPSLAQQDQHSEQGHPDKQQAKSDQHHAQQPKQSEQKQQQAQHAQQQSNQKQHEQHAQQQHPSDQKQQSAHHSSQPQQKQKQQQHAQNSKGTQHSTSIRRRLQHTGSISHAAWQQHSSQHWDSDHRNWQQRGGYRGYRIPDARYRGYFGRDHGFRIYGLPFLVVGGYPRFQYHGYW